MQEEVRNILSKNPFLTMIGNLKTDVNYTH